MNPYGKVPYVALLILKKEYGDRARVERYLGRQYNADWYNEQLRLVNEWL